MWMRLRKMMTAFALPLAWIAAPLDASANADAELVARLEALETEIALVKRRLEVKQEEDETKASGAALVTADRSGFQITSPDRKGFRLRIRGYLHADSRTFLGASSSSARAAFARETFAMRRARLLFEGTLFENVDFRVMPDFGGSAPTLQDAYVNLRYWPLAQLQAGQFKSPFGLERLQSATSLTFIERGFPTQLAPNRDLGVMFHGDVREGWLQYQLAVVNGVADGASSPLDSDDSKDVVARVFAQPFLETGWAPLQGLGIGFAASYGEQERAITTAYRTSGQDVFFRYAADVAEDGERLRLAPQASYYWGPFGSMFEWTRSETRLEGPTGSGEAEARAWQVAASWVLTGESASYRGVTPRNPLRPSDGAWGAFEVAARFHRLEVDDDVFTGGFASRTSSASRADAWTVGLNWYLNPLVKLALDYERTEFEDGGALLGTDRPDEGLLLTRFQLSY
jgi:phosphate-selective porin OprO/OprP